MSEDDNIIPFHKNHGFLGEWSNVIESTYDLLSILRYCASDEMNYRPEVKQKIQELIDWMEGDPKWSRTLTDASNFP